MYKTVVGLRGKRDFSVLSQQDKQGIFYSIKTIVKKLLTEPNKKKRRDKMSENKMEGKKRS
jgi:hypothetical protein